MHVGSISESARLQISLCYVGPNKQAGKKRKSIKNKEKTKKHIQKQACAHTCQQKEGAKNKTQM